jgi:hypothetical protein
MNTWHHSLHNIDSISHLFLDLEDTIIAPVVEGWTDTYMINVERVRHFINEFNPAYVHIFSFAIWNEHDKKAFQLFVQPKIERALGIKLTMIPTVDRDIIPACCEVMKLHPSKVNLHEMSDFWGKHDAFRHFVRKQFKAAIIERNIVLLDDMVFNEQFCWPDINIKGHILNVESLFDPAMGKHEEIAE